MQNGSQEFWTPERVAASLTEARSWLGTRHANRMAVKGSGIDCIHFVRECMVAGGACDSFRLPYYDQRLGIGNARNTMEALFLHCFHAVSLPADTEPLDGDVVVFKVGRESNHCGMIFAGQVFHAVARSYVRADPWGDWRENAQALLRITAPGFRKNPEHLTKAEIVSPP